MVYRIYLMQKLILLVLYNILSMHLDDLCIKQYFVIEVCFYLMLIISFNSRKIFKAYYGFRVLYVFPFPSAGHGPIGSGRDKVGIRAYVLMIIQSCLFLCYCGEQVDKCRVVIIASRIPRYVCTLSCLEFVCFILFYFIF